MRVALNRFTALRQKTGIGHYIAELLRCLPQVAAPLELLLFPGPLFSTGLSALGQLKKLPNGLGRTVPAKQSRAERPWGRHWQGLSRKTLAGYFRVFSWTHRFDLYHETNLVPWPCARPTVTTIHDLSVLLFPQWHPPERVAFYEKHFEPGLRRCARVLAISEFTRAELVRHFGYPADQVSVTLMGTRAGIRPMAAGETQEALRRQRLPGRYLLYVGTLEPRKNLAVLLRAFAALPLSLRSSCPLVLAGGSGWRGEELAPLLDEAVRHHGVRRLGYVADGDLPALYNGARALVYPSHYEGFGLPPLEMLACGGAALASRAGALVEVLGSQAHLTEAEDEAGWRQALAKIITDDDWHGHLRRGGLEHARRYSWEQCAQQTWQAYQQVLHPPAAQAA